MMLYKAKVSTKETGLNIRQSIPNGKVLGEAPKGAEVEVLAEYDGWDRVKYGDLAGYASAAYLTPAATDALDKLVGEMGTDTNAPTTTLVSASGQSITLVGEWRVAND